MSQQRQQQLDDLRAVAQVGPGKLQKLAELLAATQPAPIKPAGLIAVFAQQLDEGTADTVARVLVSMAGWSQHAGVPGTELIENLSESIGTDIEEFAGWNESKQELAALVDSSSIHLVAKGIELAYEQTPLLRSTKVLTDIRPIFSKDAKAIDGGIVSFNLRLGYSIAETNKALSLAMDKQDAEILREQLERALAKAETAKSWLESQEIPVVVSGE